MEWRSYAIDATLSPQPNSLFDIHTRFVPYDSNDNDKLEEMHMAHKPFCRLNPGYGVDLIKMQQTSMSTGYARRVIREMSGPQVQHCA